MDNQNLTYTPTLEDVDPWQAGVNKAEDKHKALEQAKANKLNDLTARNNASLTDSYTVTEDGYQLNNANKLYNSLSSGDLGFLLDELQNNQQLFQDESGQWGTRTTDAFGQTQFTPYEGSVRRLYGYNTDDNEFKIGLARGDMPTSDWRYTPGKAEEAGLSVGKNGYGWAPGEEGLNLDSPVMDMVLPYDVATAFEALVHGNENALGNRVNKFTSQEERDAAREAFGSGASEYYRSANSIFDRSSKQTSDEELLKILSDAANLPATQNKWEDYSLYNDEGVRIRKRSEMTPEERAAELALLNQTSQEEGSLQARAANTVAAFGRTLFKEAGLDLSDWVGEGLDTLTGGAVGWDHGTEEEKTAYANKLVGFRPEFVNAEYAEANKLATKIVDGMFDDNKEVEFGDVLDLVKIGITTPEMLGDSTGFIASFFVPLLGWGGKAAKADKIVRNSNNIIKATEKALKAGDISSDAAKAAVIAQRAKIAEATADVTVLNKLTKYAQQNAGLMQVSAGNVNDQIDAYKEEHGEAPSIGKVAQMMATETLMLSLDRWADLSILKAPAALKGVREAFSVADKAGKAALLGKAVGVAADLTVNMGKEAGQEYLQEIGQEFNVKFNFDDNGSFLSAETLDEAKDVFLSRDMQIVGVTGAGLGAGGAVQFSAVGGTIAGARNLLNGATNLVNTNKPQRTPQTTQETTSLEEIEASAAPVTEDEITTAKKAYGSLLTRVRDEVLNTGVTADNVGVLLDDLDELNRTMHVISSSSPEAVAKGKEAYDTVVNSLEDYIRNNSDAVLTQRKVVRKTLEEAVQDNVVAEQFAALPENIKTGFKELGEVLGDGSPRSVEQAFKEVVSTVGKSSFEEAIEEQDTVAPFLRNLEQALNGTTSEELADTYANIQKYIADNKLGTIANKITFKDIPTGTVLGSDTSSKDSSAEFTPYDDYARAVEAERIVQTLLGSGREYDEDFKNKLYNFARRNGIKEAKLNSIVKSYESVEEEAVAGNRGYVARLTRLKGLIESSNPDNKAITREMNNIVNMQSSLEASIQNLQNGIKEAVNEAAKLNKRPTLSDKRVPITTQYKKADGKPFVIYINKNQATGKWEADIAEAEKRLAPKKEYVKDIINELRRVTARSNTKLPGVLENLGTYQVPEVAGRGKVVREKDAKFTSRISEMLESVGLDSNITKVVVGEDATSKWTPKGDYAKANTLLLNNNEVDSSDVVLVNTIGTRKVGKDYYYPSIVPAKTTEELTPAQASFKAAVDAGATIVLDRELDSKKNAASRKALANYLTKQGYTLLDGYYGSVFVKATEANKAIVKERAEAVKAEKAQKQAKADKKDKLVAIGRAIATGVNPKTGAALTDTAKATLRKEMVKLSSEVISDFDNDDNRLLAYINRRIKQDVEEAAKAILADPNPVPVSTDDKAFDQAVQEYIAEEEAKDVAGQSVITDWKQLVEEDELTGLDLSEALTRLLRKIGSGPKDLIKSIFGERSFSTGKNDLYELQFEEAATGKLVTLPPKRKAPTEAEIKAHIAANEAGSTSKANIFKGKKHIFLGVRRVVQDPSKLVTDDRITVLNSIPTDKLPFAIRDLVSKFTAKASKALEAVSDAELADQTDARVDGSFLKGSFNLYNSPARGIIFNNEGKPNEEVLAAMYLAIGDMLKTDLSKLIRGYKTDADIANMFGVQEFEVTPAMRDFVKENGAFLKTVANSLGSSILKQLGLAKRKGDDVSANEFEALVADLGNSALLLAEQQGILEATSVPSNEVAKLFRDGEIREENTKTIFINVKDKSVTKNGHTRKEPIKAVTDLVEEFGALAETFPEARPNRKEPSFKAPGVQRLKKALNNVRNDIIGLDVPSNAQETLKLLMNTAYEYADARVDEFLAALDNSAYNVKELLGYVDLDSDEFKAMLFKDKEIQEAKNRDIEKSIEELKLLKKRIQESGKLDPALFFDYFYAGNNRYMLDSNTINPQTDKIIRFLIVPQLHKIEYTVTTSSNNGLLFTAKSSTGVSDQSYTVRMAIAQGLGQGVDKLNPQKVISFADAVLSMSVDQINVAKDALLTKGDYKLVTADGVTHELEAEHITHALQVIDFLRELKKAQAKGTSFTSSLSLEFDSLTSGFANKVQQMPILKDMDQHFARTGVLTEAYQQQLMGTEAFPDGFLPEKGHSIADVLDAGKTIGFYDSYQNLAKTTIDALKTGEVQARNLTMPASAKATISGNTVFNAIKPLLPGGQFMEDGVTVDEIKGAIRNLFKDPFMIFNYSASIGRIITNLGINVAENLAREIATADLSKDKNAGIKQAANALLGSAEIYRPKENASDANVRIKTAEELQKLLREYPIKRFGIKQFHVGTLGKKRFNPRNMEELLENVVKLTYGEVIKEVFEKEFKPFIEVQDAMNDAFKTAFRVFDAKRMEKLSALRRGKDTYIITAKDHADVLEELWEDFPWIVGPLSGAKDKEGVRKAVIAVATSSTRSPRPVEMARVSPQTRLGTAYGEQTRTVSPLIKYLEEAVSAGSVLPFHAIDGAEMSFAVNALAEELGLTQAGITAIHDAVIAPLDQSDSVGFHYQKGMVQTNTEYVLADALKEMADRLRSTIEDKRFDADFKNVSEKGLKALDKDAKETFPSVAKKVVANLDKQIQIIKDAREKYYGPNGLLKNAWYGNLVGMGMYQVGMDKADRSYVNAFEPMYSAVELDFEPKIDDNTINNIVDKSGAPAVQQAVRNVLNSMNEDTVLEDALAAELPQATANVVRRIADNLRKELEAIDAAVTEAVTEQTVSGKEAEVLKNVVAEVDKGCNK